MNDIVTEGDISDEQLRKTILELSQITQQQAKEIERLKEQLSLFNMRFFGRKSEKLPAEEITDQLSFLQADPPDSSLVTEEEPEEVEVPAHKRVKKGRKPIPDHLPVTELIHDLDESDKICGCGNVLRCIGKESHKQLVYTPATLQVVDNIRLLYACDICEGVQSEGPAVKSVPPIPQMLPKTMSSPSLLAYIVVSKFVDALPFYRLEKIFERLGYKLSRTNMVNWTIQLGKRLDRLLELLYEELRQGTLIHLDETTIQVNKEEGRKASSKSYMWVMKGGLPETPSIYFHYDPSRSKEVAQSLLKGYEGRVVTDGYNAYSFIGKNNPMQHAACWAHVRRKFMDVLNAKGASAKSGNADEALKIIRQFYRIEKEVKAQDFSESQHFFKRVNETRPLMDYFFEWLKTLEPAISPKSLLGKAIAYALKLEDQLRICLSDSIIPLDNNAAENAIRPFVIGRKNFLFCDTPAGAVANARLYSLIETAKANGLNPYEYLKDLFEQFPYAETTEQLRSLLPQYIHSAK